MTLHTYVVTTYLEVVISFVIAIKQTDQSTNQERPCTTFHQMKKELSICQSL